MQYLWQTDWQTRYVNYHQDKFLQEYCIQFLRSIVKVRKEILETGNEVKGSEWKAYPVCHSGVWGTCLHVAARQNNVPFMQVYLRDVKVVDDLHLLGMY